MFLTCASEKGLRQIPDTLERFRLSALVGTRWCYSEELDESYYLDPVIWIYPNIRDQLGYKLTN